MTNFRHLLKDFATNPYFIPISQGSRLLGRGSSPLCITASRRPFQVWKIWRTRSRNVRLENKRCLDRRYL